MEVLVLETPELGDRSYVIGDGGLAAVVDPQRDIDRILDATRERGWRVTVVLETHLHNDYVSGGLELSRRTGAAYVVAGGEEATYDCRPAEEGQEYRLGRLTFAVVKTPGHTLGHAAFVLSDRDRQLAAFTGGSMLFGTVGRTDLVSPELTERLSRHQHRSVRRLATDLHPEVQVLPTHGFGSFCASSAGSGAQSSTIALERTENLACRIDDEDRFVTTLAQGLGAYPSYYLHMGLINRAGPSPLDLSPPARVEPSELGDHIAGGEWVVDLRPRRAYAGGHLPGSVGVEMSPGDFTTYLGWVLPWGTPVVLVGKTQAELAAAQRAMARIGIDRPAGAALLPPGDGLAGDSYPVADLPGLRRALGEGRKITVLDVRSEAEWSAGHLQGALWVPLGELRARLRSLPRREIWVHCQAGYRASVAASLLARSGHRVVLVDDQFENAAAHGLEVTAAPELPQPAQPRQ